jgi:two-component system sensor kinase FixL
MSPLTDRDDLEHRLRASEARWRSIVESAVDGIVVIDSRGCIESFNPAAERLFGYAEADVIGQNVNILMPAPDCDEHDAYLSRYLRTGERRVIGIGREVTAKRRDGTVFPVRLSVGEMSVEGDRKFTGILQDLTERIGIEKRLREQTALARLGEMAAVIAHEVKNPLAGVRGAIQVIGRRLPQESNEASVVKEAVGRIDALDNLLKDLLLFARPPQPRPAPVDLVRLMRVIVELLSTDPVMENVDVVVAGEAPLAQVDAELLKIVFQNLFVNAAQAMQGRGTIEVMFEAHPNSCRVIVRDTGPGIPAEVREQIFTPFFTTKARGTGLGLPTAKRIIDAHSGSIAIHCPLSGGTVVTVDIPAGVGA